MMTLGGLGRVDPSVVRLVRTENDVVLGKGFSAGGCQEQVSIVGNGRAPEALHPHVQAEAVHRRCTLASLGLAYW